MTETLNRCSCCDGVLERDRSIDNVCCVCTDNGRRAVRVRYSSDVLGDGVFFEGVVSPETTLNEIRNVCALELAKSTARNGLPHSSGMWRAELL